MEFNPLAVAVNVYLDQAVLAQIPAVEGSRI
jgi:hypothetical protein